MNCLHCNALNENDANFCKNCGAELHLSVEQVSNSKTPETLLLVFLLITFITTAAQFGMQKIIENWFQRPTRYIQGFLWIVQNLSFIMVALAIKNKELKIVALVVTSVMVIYWIYGNIEFMLRP